MDQQASVYVLRSLRDCRRYIGSSHDKDTRFGDHNLGKVGSTRFRRPLVMTYCECCENIAEARKREKYFKTAAGRRFLDKVETPTWEAINGRMK